MSRAAADALGGCRRASTRRALLAVVKLPGLPAQRDMNRQSLNFLVRPGRSRTCDPRIRSALTARKPSGKSLTCWRVFKITSGPVCPKQPQIGAPEAHSRHTCRSKWFSDKCSAFGRVVPLRNGCRNGKGRRSFCLSSDCSPAEQVSAPFPPTSYTNATCTASVTVTGSEPVTLSAPVPGVRPVARRCSGT